MNFIIYQRVVNTFFKKNKQVILSSLFLICYVVYAISPISYSYSVKRIIDGIGEANGMPTSFNNLNIFLMKVTCTKIDSIKEINHAGSTVIVLIRKARAVLPENVSVNLKPPENLWLFGHITSFFYNSSSRLLVSSDNGNSNWEFNPLHSGPSPPVA